MKKKYLIVIVGPTAVGKTSTCVEVAKHFDTEIIYADSRQFFKEMEIGTAKPTPDEMDGIPHHFVDFLSITDDYSAGDFERDALQKINELFEKHDILILSGGSGLYVQAVCEGMDDIPADQEIRAQIVAEYNESGLEPLVEELKEKDPEYYEVVDRQNIQRIQKAIEIIRTSGKTFTEMRLGQKAKRPFEIITVGLNRDREELYDRINLRVDLMLENGLEKEVEALKEYKHLNALQTVGYKEIFDWWDGVHDKTEAIRLLKRNSRRYAKRQLTWFRRNHDTVWFHPDQLEEIEKYIEEKTKQ
ncbi:tRNA (adenosine(37)-N6)-dimethylallyltransferase MiaA [Sediminitomix flava]|uniref:tRNA dimethylallyltransferase n=1 Tax=Sediminitomix flava TaxID=379075 RepID=A0A315Z0P6_SEDFL|nr:tRNA (adenosine(37)-N6)-dimethylallyltransferase MiaA [Sediminitomix flava]PWJ35994.1 tRNA dimethylallyltransferase [Sediminitomix flava]